MAKVVKSADRFSRRSTRDGRRRIDFATEEMFGLTSIQCDIVIYDVGDEASAHKHTDADHIFLVIRGTGRFFDDDDVPHEMSAGDVVHIPAGEFHNFDNTGDEPFELVEIWVPKPSETIWKDPDDP